MEKRTTKTERNTRSLVRDNDGYSKNKIDSTYCSRSSEESTTEDEVEFEGWIEFVSKKDAKNKNNKEGNGRKSEAKLRDISKKSYHTKYSSSSTNVNSNNRNGATLTIGNKKMAKEKENDSVNNKGEGKTRKTDTIHAQIHAQVHTSVPVTSQNSTSLQGQINTFNTSQIPLLAQLQGIGQHPIKLSFTGQIPVTTDATPPLITTTSTPVPLQIQMQVPTQQTVQHTSPASANVTTGVVQQVQETVTHTAPQQVQHMQQTMPQLQQVQQPVQQIHQVQQQAQQPLQQIHQVQQQVQQPVQQIHQVQQQVQHPVQQIHQIQQPVQQIHQIQQPIQQIHQIQQPVQQIHQIQQPVQQIHQIQQPVQQIHQGQHQIQNPVQIQHIQQPVQQVHQIQHQVQNPVQIQHIQQQMQPQMQLLNGHITPGVNDGTNTVLIDPMSSMIVNNEQGQPPVFIRQPPTVVVANQPGPPIFINPPPANVILENPPPQPIYINNPRPNIIMKNSSSMHSPSKNIITMQSNNGNLGVDGVSPQVVVQHGGGAGVGGSVTMMSGENVNVIDNNNNTNKNIFVVKRNANGTGTIPHNDFMLSGNILDSRTQTTSNIFIPDMGNTQALHIPRHVQVAQSHSCLPNICSCLNPPVAFSTDTNNVTGNIYDMGFIHNVQQMEYPQEIQFAQAQQFAPQIMTPMMNAHHMVHMSQHPQMMHMDSGAHPQIIQNNDINASHMFYDNNFGTEANASMVNNGAVHLPMSMSMAPTMYMSPQAQAANQMMNARGGCAPLMTMMPNSRSTTSRQTPMCTPQRMNSMPPGCMMPNAGYSRKNHSFNGSAINMAPRKIEITAKPAMNRKHSGVNYK